jgi:hypothetical protein
MRLRPCLPLLAAGLAIAGAVPVRADVQSFSVAARVSRDIGTVFVSGTESGPGGGIGVRASFGDDDVRWEPELAIDVAGFTGEGDGDPIVQGAILVSRRQFFFFAGDRGARPWWSVGAGVGGLAIAGGGAIFPARLAFGVSLAPDSDLGIEASVFNRFVLTSKRGDPSTEYINSTGVEIAVRFGR